MRYTFNPYDLTLIMKKGQPFPERMTASHSVYCALNLYYLLLSVVLNCLYKSFNVRFPELSVPDTQFVEHGKATAS